MQQLLQDLKELPFLQRVINVLSWLPSGFFLCQPRIFHHQNLPLFNSCYPYNKPTLCSSRAFSFSNFWEEVTILCWGGTRTAASILNHLWWCRIGYLCKLFSLNSLSLLSICDKCGRYNIKTGFYDGFKVIPVFRKNILERFLGQQHRILAQKQQFRRLLNLCLGLSFQVLFLPLEVVGLFSIILSLSLCLIS